MIRPVSQVARGLAAHLGVGVEAVVALPLVRELALGTKVPLVPERHLLPHAVEHPRGSLLGPPRRIALVDLAAGRLELAASRGLLPRVPLARLEDAVLARDRAHVAERRLEGEADQEIPVLRVLEALVESARFRKEGARQQERVQRNEVGEEEVVRVEIEGVLEAPMPLLPAAVGLQRERRRDRVGVDDGLGALPVGPDEPVEVVRREEIVVVQEPDELLARERDSAVGGGRAPSIGRELLDRRSNASRNRSRPSETGAPAVVDDDDLAGPGGLRPNALERLRQERGAVAGPHDDGDRRLPPGALREHRRPDAAAKDLEGRRRDLAEGGDPERFDGTGALERQAAVRVQAADGRGIVAHGELGGVRRDGLPLLGGDAGDVHEGVRQQRVRDLVEGDPQEAVEVVLRVSRPGGGDHRVQRFRERSMVGMHFDRRRAEDEAGPELFDLPADRRVELPRHSGELPVGQSAELRLRSAQRAGGGSRLQPPDLRVRLRLARRDALLPRAVRRDPDPDGLRRGVDRDGASRAERLVVGVGGQNENARSGDLARLVGDQRGFVLRVGFHSVAGV